MSEGSLPPFGVSGARSIPGAVARALGRLFGKPRYEREEIPPDPALSRRAADAVGRHAGDHAALFERAERLTEKASRLERAGTPSDSASNRAARARGEVEAGLAALRASFVKDEGPDGAAAFDREVEGRFPALGLKTRNPDA